MGKIFIYRLCNTIIMTVLGSITVSMWISIVQIEPTATNIDIVKLEALQWHYNKRDGVSAHRHLDCLFNRLFKRRSEKTSKLRVTGLSTGNSPVTDEFPVQSASDAEPGEPMDCLCHLCRWSPGYLMRLSFPIWTIWHTFVTGLPKLHIRPELYLAHWGGASPGRRTRR